MDTLNYTVSDVTYHKDCDFSYTSLGVMLTFFSVTSCVAGYVFATLFSQSHRRKQPHLPPAIAYVV